MTTSIPELVTALPHMKDTQPIYDAVAEKITANDCEWVADLGIALIQKYKRPTSKDWQYRGRVLDLLRNLCLADADTALPAALRLTAAETDLSPGHIRNIASMMAASPRWADLGIAYEPDNGLAVSDELRACLIHELVLEGALVTQADIVATWLDTPAWTTHPLAWLPPELTSIEGEPEVPEYNARGYSHKVPHRQNAAAATTEYTTFHGTLPLATETTTPAIKTQIEGAVSNWLTDSNGIAEARTFRLDQPITSEALPNLLASLGLECLATPSGPPPLNIGATTPFLVWSILFSAASTGGSYSYGVLGAYGRLATWKSIAALAGAPTEASFEQVYEQTENTTWHLFAADTEWFYNFIHDIGVIAVTPDNKVGILAATDID